jgi:hypothetical protein
LRCRDTLSDYLCPCKRLIQWIPEIIGITRLEKYSTTDMLQYNDKLGTRIVMMMFCCIPQPDQWLSNVQATTISLDKGFTLP